MNIIHHTGPEHADTPAHTSAYACAPVPEQQRSAAALLLTGVCSGLLLHWLVWDRIGGSLGMLLWTLCSCAAVLWLNRRQDSAWRRELLVWCLVISTAAGLAVWRDADQVMLLMYLVMFLCLGMVFYRARGNLLANATLPLVATTTLRLPASIVLSIFPALDIVIKSKWQGGSQVSAVIRGLLLAAPLLFIFVMLFASADAVFSQQLDRLADFMGELTPSTPLISAVLIVLATGLLSCSLLQQQPGTAVSEASLASDTRVTNPGVTNPGLANQSPTNSPASYSAGQMLWPGLRIRLGQAETAIVMGSLALLFLTFVLLQTSYLFGGRELIAARSGLTLADYARRGFFELLTVAVLTMAVLMALASVRCHQILFRRLGAVLIACVMIMLLSAAYRLHLYVDQFGMTMARLVALAVMVWLSFGLLWFAATVLRGNARGFLAGLVISSMACCLLLAAVNPAARVASINIEHARSNNVALDVAYLNQLGADVVPAVMAYLNEAGSPGINCIAARRWFAGRDRASTDWRDWNAARATAASVLQHQQQSC